MRAIFSALCNSVYCSSFTALREVDGFELFGQQLKLEWARSRSDAQVKKEDPEGYESFRRGRLAEKGATPHLHERPYYVALQLGPRLT